MGEYEVILSSDNDGYYFKDNTPIYFSNLINRSLIGVHDQGISCFINVKKVVVEGGESQPFIVLLEGVPLRECDGRNLPVLTSCHKSFWKGSEGEFEVYNPQSKDSIPFSLGRESEWRVRIIPWVKTTLEEVSSITKCFIHLNVRVILEGDMTFIHNLLYLKMKRSVNNNGNTTGVINPPLRIHNGHRVGLQSFIGGEVYNIGGGSNIISFQYKNSKDEIVEKDVVIPPKWYSSLQDLLSTINKVMKLEYKDDVESGLITPKENSRNRKYYGYFSKGYQERVFCILGVRTTLGRISMSNNLASLLGYKTGYLTFHKGRGSQLKSGDDTPNLKGFVIPPMFLLECDIVARTGLVGGSVMRLLSTLEISRSKLKEGFDVHHPLPHMVLGEPGFYSEIKCRVLHPDTLADMAVEGDISLVLSVS